MSSLQPQQASSKPPAASTQETQNVVSQQTATSQPSATGTQPTATGAVTQVNQPPAVAAQPGPLVVQGSLTVVEIRAFLNNSIAELAGDLAYEGFSTVSLRTNLRANVQDQSVFCKNIAFGLLGYIYVGNSLARISKAKGNSASLASVTNAINALGIVASKRNFNDVTLSRLAIAHCSTVLLLRSLHRSKVRFSGSCPAVLQDVCFQGAAELSNNKDYESFLNAWNEALSKTQKKPSQVNWREVATVGMLSDTTLSARFTAALRIVTTRNASEDDVLDDILALYA